MKWTLRFSLASVMVISFLWWTPHLAIAQADDNDVTIGQWREIDSKILGEKRNIMVSKPAGYDDSEQRYPVLYLLDGDDHFHYTSGLIGFMARNEQIPNMIVVGITNTNRTRDMTPSTGRQAGGADHFIQFIRDELMPFVDENYRTHPYRVLVGHSLGGLLAVHTLVHYPDMFDAMIVISPSLFRRGQNIVNKAEKFFHETEQLPKSLYMAVGNEGMGMVGAVTKVAKILEEKSPQGLEFDSRIMDKETHGTVPYRSTHDGMEFIFKDWALGDSFELYKAGGLAAIHEHFERTSKKFKFERKAPAPTILALVLRLAGSGQLDEARAVLEHDPENYPPESIGYMRLGRAYAASGNKAAAIECLRRAVELNPAADAAKQALKDLGVDVTTLVEPVKVPSVILREYAGTYMLESLKTQIQVTVESDALFIEASNLPKTKLTAVSESKFVEAKGMWNVTFQRDDQNRVKQITLRFVNGKKFVCPRTADRDSDKKQDRFRDRS